MYLNQASCDVVLGYTLRNDHDEIFTYLSALQQSHYRLHQHARKLLGTRMCMKLHAYIVCAAKQARACKIDGILLLISIMHDMKHKHHMI
jgi:hypothetical protein